MRGNKNHGEIVWRATGTKG